MKFVNIKLAWVCLLSIFVFTAAAPRKPVDINFKNLEIESFLRLSSKILNKNILLTAPIEGKVDFVSSKPIYEDELLDIVQSVLSSRGMTLVENDVFFEVVKLSDASQYNLPIANTATHQKQMVTKVIKIKHENVHVAVAQIRHLLSKTGKLIAINETNSLLLTDFPSNIETIQRVISLENKDNQNKVLVVHLKHAKAEKIHAEIMKILKDILNPKIPDENVNIALNKESNALVLVGMDPFLKRVQTVIEQFDIVDEQRTHTVKIMTLKNSEAKNTFKTVQSLIASKKYGSPEDTPSASVDEDTNSIIMQGPKESLDGLMEVINDLDREKPQVYVKAQIIEVNEDLTNAIGVKYGLTAGAATTSGLLSMSANIANGAIAIPADLLTQVPGFALDSSVKEALALGATIDFLKTNTAINVVSEPSIMCINNKLSSIYVGQTKNVQTVTQNGTTSVASQTREDIGLTLKVKPLISNDKKVTLEIIALLEDINEAQKNEARPDTYKKEIKTVTLVRDGENVIIGGLIKDKLDNTESKVPLLGDIPILGNLFTHSSDKSSKINLVIILTPYIVDSTQSMSTLREKLSKLDQIKNKVSQNLIQFIEKKDNDANQ